MVRYFCDKCQKEQSENNPILNYQIKAELEVTSINDPKNGEFAIEFEQLEICQPCAKEIAEECKKFIAQYKKW